MTTIGLNMPGSPDPDSIGKNLRRAAEWGYDAVEVTLDSVPLIIGGEICRSWLDFMRQTLSGFPLVYSAHIGRDIDCRLVEDYELSRSALLNSVRICDELSARVLVVHYEEKSRNARQEGNFFAAYREAADLAKELGVTICMENIEVELVDPVVDFVEEMDHPNLKLNFDAGHAFLASGWFGFDYIEAFEKFLPRLGHMHLSDNTVRFEPLRVTDRARYDGLPMGNRFTYGRGDIHLPPFFGKIPYESLFDRLGAYRGMFICEYYSSYFLPFCAGIQARVREAIEGRQNRDRALASGHQGP